MDKDELNSNLFKAVENCLINDVKIFIEAGAEVNAKNDREATPLHIATGFGFVDIVKLLLQEGATFENKNHLGRTVLHNAAYYGRPEIVLLLLNIGANIQAIDNFGNTALDLAKERYSPEPNDQDHAKIIAIIERFQENECLDSLIKVNSDAKKEGINF